MGYLYTFVWILSIVIAFKAYSLFEKRGREGLAFLTFVYFTALVIFSLFTLVNQGSKECQQDIDKGIKVLIKDKYTLDSNSSRLYMFTLETEKGFLFDRNFNINSYQNHSVGDTILYHPASCSDMSYIRDK